MKVADHVRTMNPPSDCIMLTMRDRATRFDLRIAERCEIDAREVYESLPPSVEITGPIPPSDGHSRSAAYATAKQKNFAGVDDEQAR